MGLVPMRRVPVPVIRRGRTYAEHFAFGGASVDLLGYLAHWPLTEGIGKTAAIIACLALYMEHAEHRRLERRLKG